MHTVKLIIVSIIVRTARLSDCGGAPTVSAQETLDASIPSPNPSLEKLVFMCTAATEWPETRGAVRRGAGQASARGPGPFGRLAGNLWASQAVSVVVTHSSSRGWMQARLFTYVCTNAGMRMNAEAVTAAIAATALDGSGMSWFAGWMSARRRGRATHYTHGSLEWVRPRWPPEISRMG